MRAPSNIAFGLVFGAGIIVCIFGVYVSITQDIAGEKLCSSMGYAYRSPSHGPRFCVTPTGTMLDVRTLESLKP